MFSVLCRGVTADNDAEASDASESDSESEASEAASLEVGNSSWNGEAAKSSEFLKIQRYSFQFFMAFRWEHWTWPRQTDQQGDLRQQTGHDCVILEGQNQTELQKSSKPSHISVPRETDSFLFLFSSSPKWSIFHRRTCLNKSCSGWNPTCWGLWSFARESCIWDCGMSYSGFHLSVQITTTCTQCIIWFKKRHMLEVGPRKGGRSSDSVQWQARLHWHIAST